MNSMCCKEFGPVDPLALKPSVGRAKVAVRSANWRVKDAKDVESLHTKSSQSHPRQQKGHLSHHAACQKKQTDVMFD